eukprot:TRINITY_DN26660_c0_g1_i1.p1 TRINITY_DN26660_c0_g1~~TRINITY_DN26660_c0_g1_i1.p1  ORF type:complete len:406 (+),score=125.92 TRINITY_DN26660_c0_g1_i1:117-1220(+)
MELEPRSAGPSPEHAVPTFRWWRAELRRQLQLSAGTPSEPQPGEGTADTPERAPRSSAPWSPGAPRPGAGYRRVLAERFAAHTLHNAPRGLTGVSDALVERLTHSGDVEEARLLALAGELDLPLPEGAQRLLPDSMSPEGLYAALLRVEDAAGEMARRRAAWIRQVPRRRHARPHPQRAALAAVLRRFAPLRLSDADDLLAAAGGDAAGLFAALRAEFAADPQRQEGYRKRIARLLARHAEGKVDELDALLLLYEGREEDLIASLRLYLGVLEGDEESPTASERRSHSSVRSVRSLPGSTPPSSGGADSCAGIAGVVAAAAVTAAGWLPPPPHLPPAVGDPPSGGSRGSASSGSATSAASTVRQPAP